MVQKEIINILEEKIKDLEEFISAGRGYISTKEYEEMIETLYSAIEVFEMWPISYDVSESVKPKTQKIKLSEIRQLVRKSLNEANEINKKYTHFLIDKNNNKIVNGFEYPSTDKESINYYLKQDIKDQFPDRKPSEFKLVSKSSLEKSGMNPFDVQNWKSVNEEESCNECNESKKVQKIKVSEVRKIVKSALNEKWKGDAKVEKTGEHADKTVAELKKELKDLKEKSKKYQDQGKKVPKSIIDQEREIVFAIRAKQGWKKGKGAIGESQLKEAKQDYETYHNSFTDAATDAREMAEKRGYTIDEDDWWNEVASGGRYGRARPAIGKTHTFTVGLLKDGKPQRKALIFTVYGMESGRYELVAYIN